MIEVKYIVDFDPMLAEIISETKYMEQLGFSVPELARNVALQVSSCLSVCHFHILFNLKYLKYWWNINCCSIYISQILI